MEKDSKIYVAGHRGMVGSSVVRELIRQGYDNIICKTHQELDLTRQEEVERFFRSEQPEYVFLVAAKVGGIKANMTYPTEFLMENLQIQNNVITSAYSSKVKKLMFFGSSCIYPKEAKQPIKEEYLLTGPLEPTNEGYAIAKIAGLKACEYYRRQHNADFISIMPCNLYGIGDNFDLSNSHVIPALIRKFHEAKIQNKKVVEVWGTGKVYRELLFCDDLAEASIFLMNNNINYDFVNVGYGKDFTLCEIANTIKEVVGFKGEIIFDTTKPEGMKRKLTDTSKIIELGWKPKTQFKQGIQLTYNWFLENIEKFS